MSRRGTGALFPAALIAVALLAPATAPGTETCSGTACKPLDFDHDGIKDYADNCPKASNPKQDDNDGDTPQGADAGDPTGNPVVGPVRVWGHTPVQTQYETDTDMPETVGGDNCDVDDDNDGIWDKRVKGKKLDNCRLAANPDQKDADGDAKGDACDAVFDPPAVTTAKLAVRGAVRMRDITAGLPVKVACSARCDLRAQLRRGSGTLARAKATLTGAGTTYLFLRIPSATLKRLRRAGKPVATVVRVELGSGGAPVARRVQLRP